MKNLKKTSLAVILGCSLFCSMPTFAQVGGAISGEWPVADNGVRKALLGLSQQFEVQSERDKSSATLAENNATAQNIAMTSVSIANDFKRIIEQSTPDLRKCQDLTSRMGNSGTVGQGDSMLAQLNKVAQAQRVTTQGDTWKNRKERGVCTINDVANNIDGCSMSDIDPVYAGADMNGDIISRNFEDGSLTLSDKQMTHAEAYIENIGTSFLPPNSSTSGKNNQEYQKILNDYRATIDAVKASERRRLAQYAPMPMNPSSAAGLEWFSDKNKNEYKQFFGSNLPTNPSVMTRRKMEAYKKAYGQDMSINMGGDELMQLRSLVDIQAKSLVRLEDMLEAQRESIAKQNLILTRLTELVYTMRDPDKIGSTGK